MIITSLQSENLPPIIHVHCCGVALKCIEAVQPPWIMISLHKIINDDRHILSLDVLAYSKELLKEAQNFCHHVFDKTFTYYSTDCKLYTSRIIKDITNYELLNLFTRVHMRAPINRVIYDINNR